MNELLFQGPQDFELLSGLVDMGWSFLGKGRIVMETGLYVIDSSSMLGGTVLALDGHTRTFLFPRAAGASGQQDTAVCARLLH